MARIADTATQGSHLRGSAQTYLLRDFFSGEEGPTVTELDLLLLPPLACSESKMFSKDRDSTDFSILSNTHRIKGTTGNSSGPRCRRNA